MSFSYAYSLKNQEVTVTNCDREPVHVPGCIQPFGALLVLRPEDRTLLQVSDNTEQWFAEAPQALLQRTLVSIVGEENDAALCKAMEQGLLGPLPSWVFSYESSVGRIEMLAHLHDGMLILEGEAADARLSPEQAYLEVNRITGRLQQSRGLQLFCQTLAEEVRRLTGLDRVMIYRFQQDLSGEVFAEARREDLTPYLSLRYPSEDIPAPAREIFRKIWVRPLPAVQYTPSELVPLLNPESGKPLDMTYCFLRGASVMYTEYLRNMGVAMALTLSIVVDGHLWGLVACHHTTPKIIPWQTRAACELLAQVASLQLRAAEQADHAEYRARMQEAAEQLTAQLAEDKVTLTAVMAHQPTCLDFIESGGVALYEGGVWTLRGRTPNKTELKALLSWLEETRREGPLSAEIIHTHALSERFPAARAFVAVASGILAAPISRNGQDVILWFRPEVTQTVPWAGDPTSKVVEATPHGERLLPRTSFALWQESVKEQSLPWLPVEMEAARRLRLSLIEVAAMRTEEVTRQNRELAISNDELDAFAYITSHDLREPLRGIYHYAHYLKEGAETRQDARAIGQTESLSRLVKRMDGLIESLLHFSRVGRTALEMEPVDMGQLAEEAIDILYARVKETNPDIRLQPDMPRIACDAIRVREIWTTCSPTR